MKISSASALSPVTRYASAAVFALSAIACGGGTAAQVEPEDPPLYEAPDENTLAPSSAAVEEGITALKAEDYAKAETILSKAVADSPEDPQANLYYGMALEGLKKFEEAASAYARAVEITPQLIEASQHLSALYLDLGQNEEALAVAVAGLKETPGDAPLLVNKAYAVDLLGAQGQPNPEAIKAYEAALKADPNNLQARYYYAAALATAGEKEKSLAQLQKIPLDGKFIPVVEVITVYGQLSAFDQCVVALDKQLVAAPSVELYIHRAACKSSGGDEAAALADLKEAVQKYPKSADAHYYLAKHLTRSNKPEEARTHLEKAAEVGPDTRAGKAAAGILAKSKSK